MSEDFIKSKFIPGFLSAVQAGILGFVGSSAFDLFPEAAGTSQARRPLFIKSSLIQTCVISMRSTSEKFF